MKSLITIKSIQESLLSGFKFQNHVDDDTSRRMWWSSLEIIQNHFLHNNYQNGGLWVASPLPAINSEKYLQKFQGWLWAPEGFPYFNNDHAKYLPDNQSQQNKKNDSKFNYQIFKLNKEDGFEPFLMIITPKFQCVLTIFGEKNKKFLIMRSDEQSLKKVIELVTNKLSQEDIQESKNFQIHLRNLGELSDSADFINDFWPTLSSKLGKLILNADFQSSFKEQRNRTLQISEAKLLEAISHEVRTPLATIRTLIGSTLRKYEMDETIRNRLIEIDNECTEQIDRFGLIFNAAELVNGDSDTSQQLTSIDLGGILNKLSPNWVKQLNRRGIKLKTDIPDNLPEVLSNSEKLELMLGGLIDKNTRGLREGSILILELRPAGQKLKLQLVIQNENKFMRNNNIKDDGSDIGPVLNWNPQTGSLQLSQSATQKLLASLGGRVTRRKDSGLTVFFPISES